MLTRREFLAAAGAPLLVRWRTAPLRVVVLRESHAASPAMLAGARMAADEVSRAAAMFGAAVHVREEAIAPGRLPREVDVVVGGMSGVDAADRSRLAEHARVIFLNVGSSDDALRGCGTYTFHVAASDSMKRDALRIAGTPGGADVELWLPTLEAFGAAQLNDRFRHATGRGMDSAAWAGWLAVKVAAEAHFRGGGAPLRDRLASDTARFDGHKGKPLSFRAWDRQLRQPLYVVPPGDGADAVEVPRRGGGGTAREQLDLIGARAATSTCTPAAR